MGLPEPHPIRNLHLNFSPSSKIDAIPIWWTYKAEAIFTDGYLSFFANHFLAQLLSLQQSCSNELTIALISTNLYLTNQLWHISDADGRRS